MWYIISYPSDLGPIVSGSPSNISPLPPSFPTLLSLSPQFLRPRLLLPSAAARHALTPRISRSVCYHHRLDRHSPVFRSTARYKSMIGRVVMYCATVFCRRVMYTLISSIPTVVIAAPMGGYTHVPSCWRLELIPVICRTARGWKPSKYFSNRWVSTHVSYPNRIYEDKKL